MQERYDPAAVEPQAAEATCRLGRGRAVVLQTGPHLGVEAAIAEKRLVEQPVGPRIGAFVGRRRGARQHREHEPESPQNHRFVSRRAEQGNQRRGVGYWAEFCSPRFRDPSALYAAASIESRRNRTDPSA